jgi:hypothetical protein
MPENEPYWGSYNEDWELDNEERNFRFLTPRSRAEHLQDGPLPARRSCLSQDMIARNPHLAKYAGQPLLIQPGAHSGGGRFTPAVVHDLDGNEIGFAYY